MPAVKTEHLAAFLRREFGGKLHGRDRLRVLLRPYTCPFDELLAYIEPGSTIFDIGCGPGTFLALALEFYRPGKAVGIDIQPAAVDTAGLILRSPVERGIAGISQGDGRMLPDSVSEADVVFLIDVFHYIPAGSRLQFMAGLYKKMKPGGRLVFKDIDAADRLLVWFNRLHNLIFSRGVANEMRLQDAVELFQSTGFEIDSQLKRRMYWYSHFTLVCRKPV